jgi:hypothetical protein
MTRETHIGVGVSTLAVAAMAVDHLLGDDPGLEDPPAFVLSSALSLAVAVLAFGYVVPGARTDPARAAWRATAWSAAAVLTLPLLFLGLPFVVGGAGVALALLARRAPSPPRRASAALLVGGLVVLLATAVYVGQAATKL